MFTYTIHCHNDEQVKNVIAKARAELKDSGVNADDVLDIKITGNLIQYSIPSEENKYFDIDADSMLQEDEAVKLFNIISEPTYTDWLIEYVYYPTDAIIEKLQLLCAKDTETIGNDQLAALMEIARARCYTEQNTSPNEVQMIQELLVKLNPDFTL
jgi:uncharacterized protein with ATP-grasp and redox domains